MQKTLCFVAASIVVAVAVAGCKKDDPQKAGPAGAAGAADASVTTQAAIVDAGVAGASGATNATSRDKPAPVFHAFHGKIGKGAFWLGMEARGDALRAIYATSGAASLVGKMTDASHFTLHETHVPKGEKPTTIAGEMSAEGALIATLSDPKTQKKTPLTASGGAVDDAGRAFKEEYTGSLGGRFIRMKIEKSGAKITGIYRYSKSAEDIKLEGTAKDADASFELTESVHGKVTGKFTGVFVSKSYAIASWSSPDGTKSFPVKLEHGDGYPETVDVGGGLTLFPQETVIDGKRCKADIVFPQLRGAKDATKQTALNVVLRGDEGTQKTCDGPDEPDIMDYEESYSYEILTQKKGRFVGLSQAGYSYTGGAHGLGASQCGVIDTKTLARFRMVDSLTAAGRKKLGELTTKELQKENGVAKLTDAYFFADDVEIGKDTNVCLSDTEIEVEFAPYEVAPYVAGAPSAKFAKADVRDLFEKNELMDAALAP